MKTFKKALSIILGVAIMLSCLFGMQVSVVAEETETPANPLTIGVGEVNVADGVVTVPVIATGSAQAFAVTAAYDDAVLDLVSGEKVAIGVDDSAVVGPTDANPFKMMWAFAEVTEDVVFDNTTIATLTFNIVAATAESANIDLEVTEAWDVDGDEVTATATDGTVEFVKECAHDWGTGVVTTQPTKDAEGVRTFTCGLCGETKTEAIAKPVATEAVGFRGDIVVSSVVGANIFLSTKNMRTEYGDDATYFIVVDYQKYATGYVLEDKSITLTTADRLEGGASNNNKDLIAFNDIALYEMTLDFTMTAYFMDSTGVVVGYREVVTNIAKLALAYAADADAKLLTALADMCVYGDEAQKYFANANPGTDICDATLPSAILGETYMAAKSSTEGMPAAGEYNNDKGYTKIVSSTGFLSSNQSLVIGASNQISYLIRYDNYDWSDVRIEVIYEDSLKGEVKVTLTEEDLIPNGTTNSGYPKYTYYFKDLALYDCDKTVTMNMYYKDTLELTSAYSFGNFVNTYIANDSFAPILTAMELFSNSVGVQLGLSARW